MADPEKVAQERVVARTPPTKTSKQASPLTFPSSTLRQLELDRKNLQFLEQLGWRATVNLLYNVNSIESSDSTRNSNNQSLAIRATKIASPIVIREPIQSIQFKQSLQLDLEYDQNKNLVSINGDRLISYEPQNKVYTAYSGTTKNGWSVTRRYEAETFYSKTPGKCIVEFSISQDSPERLLPRLGVNPVPVDLSYLDPRLEGVSLEQMIQQAPVRSQLQSKPYNVFLIGEQPNDIQQITAKLSLFTQGVSEAERFFGRVQGSTVRDIHLLPTDDDQAHSFNDKTLGITRAGLKGSSRAVILAGIHECAHEFDSLTNFSERFLKDFHAHITLLNPSAFNKLNEKEFSKVANFGHAQDNHRELFASYISALSSTERKASLEQLPLEDRRIFARITQLVIKGIDTCIAEGSLVKGTLFEERAREFDQFLKPSLPRPYSVMTSTAEERKERFRFDTHDLARALTAGYRIEIYLESPVYTEGAQSLPNGLGKLVVTKEMLSSPIILGDPIRQIVFTKESENRHDYLHDEIFAVSGERIQFVDNNSGGAVSAYKVDSRGQQSWRQFFQSKNRDRTELKVLMELPATHYDDANRSSAVAPAIPINLSLLGPEFEGKTVEMFFQVLRPSLGTEIGKLKVTEWQRPTQRLSYDKQALSQLIEGTSKWLEVLTGSNKTALDSIALKDQGPRGIIYLSKKEAILDVRDLPEGSLRSEIPLLACRFFRNGLNSNFESTERFLKNIKAKGETLSFLEPANILQGGRKSYLQKGAQELFASALLSLIVPERLSLSPKQQSLHSTLLAAIEHDIRGAEASEIPRDKLLRLIAQRRVPSLR